MTTKADSPSQGTFLQENALLVKLTRKKFNHNKMDKKLSEKLTKQVKAKGKNVVRVNKTIIPKEAVKNWMDVYTAAGKYYYTVTMPWDDASWRLLPITKYKEFVNKFREFSRQVNGAVDEFAHNLGEWIEKGMAELGEAADINDYPTAEEVRQQFAFGVDYMNIPDGNDFRAQVTQEERDQIVEHVTKRNVEKFGKAQESLFARVHEVSKKIYEKLTGLDGTDTFRDSLIGNVQELVDVLPSLNVNNNPDLDSLVAKMGDQLATLDPEDLRECDRLKEDTAEKAKAIMDEAQGFM